MRRLLLGGILLVALVALLAGTVWAQAGGPFVRPNCSTLTSQTAKASFCFDSTVGALRVWDGAMWAHISGNLSTSRLSYDSILTIFGQNNFVNNLFEPVETGSHQQIAILAHITGRASGSGSGDASSRIAVVGMAKSPGTGTGPGDWLRASNFIVTLASGDPAAAIIGSEITVNNNSGSNATIGMSRPQVGVSVVSSGSNAAEYGFTVGGTGQWLAAYQVSQGGIPSGGYAFLYDGTNATDGFSVTHDGRVQIGFRSNLGSPAEIMLRNEKNIYGLNAAHAALISMIKVNSSNTIGLDPGGVGTQVGGNFYLFSTTQASLGTPQNGTLLYCSDCTVASPCAGGGSGAIAKRINGAWVCN